MDFNQDARRVNWSSATARLETKGFPPLCGVCEVRDPLAGLDVETGQDPRSRQPCLLNGCSWTIDTPYRESVLEARQYQQEGVLCVEMEAAALFSVASFRSIQMACAFVISDLLDEEVWQPQMKNRATTDGLNTL